MKFILVAFCDWIRVQGTCYCSPWKRFNHHRRLYKHDLIFLYAYIYIYMYIYLHGSSFLNLSCNIYITSFIVHLNILMDDFFRLIHIWIFMNNGSLSPSQQSNFIHSKHFNRIREPFVKSDNLFFCFNFSIFRFTYKSKIGYDRSVKTSPQKKPLSVFHISRLEPARRRIWKVWWR